MASLFVVTPPDVSSEPLSLQEAKDHLRVTDTNSDGLIPDLITATRQLLEVWTGRALAPQTLRRRLDSFPDLPNATLKFFVPTYSVESYLARAISLMSGPIYLPRPPLVSVTSITYVDNTGATQTLATTEYVVDSDAEPARIAPAYSKPWPVTQAIQGAVNVTYKAGHGSTGTPDVPLPIKQAMRLLLSHFFEYREPVVPNISTPVPLGLTNTIDALVWAYRVMEFS